MLYKSLHFKLVLFFVLFIICIIATVGIIMLNGVFNFYSDSFTNQIEESFTEIFSDLQSSMKNDDYVMRQKEILEAHAGKLGINKYRNFYILGLTDGKYLAGSDDELGMGLIKTQNMLSAMNGTVGDEQIFGADYMDYARPIIYERESGVKLECIIYIKDTQEEMRNLSWRMVTIIIQALLLGLGIAVLLSFFLAKAITSPIQNITRAAVKLAEGNFEKKIESTSNDEIGILTDTFNDMAKNRQAMAKNLQDTLYDVSSEREKLQIIFLYLKDGVLVFAEDDMLIMMNARGSEILKEDFTYDNNFHDFLDLFKLRIEDAKDKEKLDSKESDGVSFIDISYADRVFDINIGKFKYRQENGDAEGLIVVLHDITQQYALEKSRREFVANVSHELKTPLTVIKIATETIMEYPQQRDKYLGMIMDESERMRLIVKDLLELSAFDNKKMTLHFEPVKPDIVAKTVYEAMQGESKRKNQTFNLILGKNIREISADKKRIVQVLGNIISNAIKYTGEGGTINFHVENYTPKIQGANFSGIKFCISDNGCGIPEEDQPYIFDRFYRVDQSRSKETGSTGLGLAIAKEFVQAHGGEIFLESVFNNGTTMTIILPCGNGNNDIVQADDAMYAV